MDPQLVQIHHDTVGKSSVYIDGLGDFFQQVRTRNSTKLSTAFLTELSCKSGIYQERGPKGPDF